GHGSLGEACCDVPPVTAMHTGFTRRRTRSGTAALRSACFSTMDDESSSITRRSTLDRCRREAETPPSPGSNTRASTPRDGIEPGPASRVGLGSSTEASTVGFGYESEGALGVQPASTHTPIPSDTRRNTDLERPILHLTRPSTTPKELYSV